MAYRLTAEEAVRAGLLRVVREEIDFAIAQLRDPNRSNRDKGIHEARKCIKKTRAIVRLSMPALGALGKRNNALLRDAGRGLSGFRDAAALVETVDGLLERFTDETPATALNPAQALNNLRAILGDRKKEGGEQSDPQAAMLRTIAALRRLRRSVSAWPDLTDDFSAIGEGLKKSYRKGRRVLAGVRSAPAPERFHELRKRVKDHWYHVRLLGNLWPGPMEAREKCLRDLQEWLGDDHDLAVLREGIAAEPAAFGDETAIAVLMNAIDGRQKELREAALAMAERIYEERPRDHVRRLKHLWRFWRPSPA